MKHKTLCKTKKIQGKHITIKRTGASIPSFILREKYSSYPPRLKSRRIRTEKIMEFD